MPSREKLSLRWRILFRTTPIAFALLILVSVYPVHRVGHELRDQIDSQLRAETLHLRENTTRKLFLTLEACSAIASNDVVVNAIIDNEHRQTTLQSFIRSIRLPGANVQNVVMTDYQGVPIASKRPLDEVRVESNTEWFSRVAAGESVIAVIGPELLVAQPVFYGGQPEAAIIATYQLSDFFADLCVGTESSISGITYGSSTIACSHPNFVGKQKMLDVPDSWMIHSYPVETVPGLSVTTMKSNEVIEKATRAMRLTLAFEAVASLAVLTAGLWLATSMALGNIHKFIHAIDDVRSNANLDRRVSFATSAEFVLLGDRFNAMLEEIQNTTVTREEYRIPALVAKYTDNAVIVTDPHGCIGWVNEAYNRITGYTLEEAKGQNLGSFLHGLDTDAETIETIRSAIRDRRGANVEILNYHRSGRPYWVAVEIRPITSESGEVVNFIAIESDVTERILAEIDKEHLNRKMVELSRRAGMADVAAGVLHNVGNALNSVNISVSLMGRLLLNSKIKSLSKAADLLQQNESNLPQLFSTERGKHFSPYLSKITNALVDENKDIRQELEHLDKSVEHIKRIVTKQQDNARSNVLRERIQMSELVDEALRIKSQQVADHRVTVAQEFESVQDAWVDRHMSIEILVNLIGNAVNALEERDYLDRRVTVSIGEEEDHVVCAVTDNGVGIDSRSIEKLFTHGFTTRKAGHGFGLHSSILAAKSMGGDLTASSDGLGHGATFKLRLPIETESPIRELSSHA